MIPLLPKPPRIGLALSGGGFRAAFFHLGVLARLAEARILGRVEVISTVSGGSIIGVAYYLKVKNLLENPPEQGVSDEDFVSIVWQLDSELRDAVSVGIRGHLFSNAWKNFLMIAPPIPGLRSYSRTDRLGDLLDRHLYKGIFWSLGEPELRDEHNPVSGLRRQRQIELRDLRIKPDGNPLGAKPRTANRKRAVKVPELVVNATSLNTGHLWRFEADRMGEHARIEPETAGPELASDQPDGNRILRPGYFVRSGEELDPSKTLVPQAQQDFPLALAVAASAAVPGIFSTLPISGMYANARVQLVDGGVADDQGVQIPGRPWLRSDDRQRWFRPDAGSILTPGQDRTFAFSRNRYPG